MLTLLCPVWAQDATYELKVAPPGYSPKAYTEEFPTEVAATAKLWNQIKVNALDEQTQSLRVEFERLKTARFERQTSLANQTGGMAIQYQPQPEHYPAVMVTAIRW
ncbi:MAG: hypothetical protein HY815_11345 [Candidatus Riflebacteria bacterium]|nr:hypothetical protein [Candidatus Riflebacteria bacterium]